MSKKRISKKRINKKPRYIRPITENLREYIFNGARSLINDLLERDPLVSQLAKADAAGTSKAVLLYLKEFCEMNLKHYDNGDGASEVDEKK